MPKEEKGEGNGKAEGGDRSTKKPVESWYELVKRLIKTVFIPVEELNDAELLIVCGVNE